MRRFLRALGFVLIVALAFGLGLLWPVFVRPPVVVGQDAVVSGVPASSVTTTFVREAGGFLDVRPVGREADTLFVFYPGGLVRPQAYEWLGRALAERGVRTVIPVFPLDFAFLGVNRAADIRAALSRQGATFRKVYLGGHSLGGAMAATFAKSNAEALAGLVLMGAYPGGGDDLSKLSLSVLDFAGERDGVASLAEVRGGLVRLPRDTRLVVLPGAVHSFFGRYGPQRGDGTPTVTREATEARIVRELAAFFGK